MSADQYRELRNRCVEQKINKLIVSERRHDYVKTDVFRFLFIVKKSRQTQFEKTSIFELNR